ncbi:hypothetical protein BTO06_05620 [Tenacibaculum sp. SZ-18]|nr:hypothetical protein BTO06_05620 [Tenacibaculum sp. SZ-18]
MWYNKNILISSVIVNDSLQLCINDLKKKTNTIIAKNVGRSFHTIPNSSLVSFMKKLKKTGTLFSSTHSLINTTR